MIGSRRLQNASAFVVALALITTIQPPSAANATCASPELQPTLAESMVTQGVGGTTAAAYARLTRGKETLVKLFLTLPCTVANGQYVKITNASLQVSSGAVANTLFTSFASQPALPTAIQAASPADPVFVVPAANLIPGAADSTFTANFTATVTYAFSDGTTAGTGTNSKTFPVFSKDFDGANALRVYVVPMGDSSQPFSTQYTPIDQTIVQNAMQTLSRIYPVQSGVVDLTLASGGVRYVVDTATMLDLKSIPGAYVTSGATKFCGTSANFSAIKGLLAQYLLTHNKANRAATADRVIGVVGGNGSLSGLISFGTENNNGCADGMASVSSAEAWVRLVADQTGAPSRSGSLAAMEVTHTFSLEQTSSYHSSKIEADLDGTVNTDRSYNSVTRSRIPNDHSVMNFNNTGSPWNNDTTLLEANDFAFLFCKLRPASTTGCTTPGKIGSSTGVAAGEKYVIAGTTDGLPANTSVIEPYYALDVAETPESTDSLLRLLQLDTSSQVVANFGMPWGEAVTDHDVVGDRAAILGGPRTFYAAAPGFSTAAGEVRLVKLGNLGDPPLNGVTLFSSLTIAPPSITSLSAVNPPGTGGGVVTLSRSQVTPRIPPKPDIVFLADTTGSMGTSIDNVKTNVVEIMNQVRQAQPDAQFAVASYQDQENCASDAYMFRLEQALTTVTEDVQAGVNSWTIGNGCDFEEAQLNALFRLGVGDDGTTGEPKLVGYRENSSRVVVWFGDAPGHDPSGGHTETGAIQALNGNSVRVVAVSIENPEIHTTLNLCNGYCTTTVSDGQADRIAAATNGVVKNTTDPDAVSQAILDGLHDLSITVTPVVNADACDPKLSVAFSPTSQIVTSGTTANFTETVTVASGATAGTHTCQVLFKLDGQVQSDPAFTQVISINVGGTGQQYIKVTAQSSDPARLLLDLIYQCADFNFVAAVAIQPTSLNLALQQATFNTTTDTTNACARFGGGGTLVPYVSDGWNRVAGTGVTAQTNTPSAPKTPTAAIYSPTIGAQLTWDGTLALRGSGQVAGIELPGTALSWSLIPPSGGMTIAAGTGSVVDVRAPSNGWAKGTWTAVLTVTFCQTSKKSECVTSKTSRTFEVTNDRGSAYEFIGFLSPVNNWPALNTGTAGKSFAFKWQLKSGGTLVSDLSTVVSTTFATATSCDTTGVHDFANTSGQSVLRFDQTNMQFVFNWQTPSQAGLYVFRLTLSDGSIHDACVTLTKK